jgi:ribosomal protein L19E
MQRRVAAHAMGVGVLRITVKKPHEKSEIKTYNTSGISVTATIAFRR